MNIFQNRLYDLTDTPVLTVRIITDSGFEVELITLGACIRKISLHPENTPEKILTLSFLDIKEYISCNSYAGMTVGPNAGRISAANGLIPNERKNQLHGGSHNLSTINWELKEIYCKNGLCTAVFCTSQTNGTDGWHGNRIYSVAYTIDESGCLTIHYSAESDMVTYINMTNHTYWNLTACPEKAMNQELYIPAASVCQNDSDFLPVSVLSMKQMFSQKGLTLKQNNIIPLSCSWNNGFLLKELSSENKVRAAAILKDPESGTTVRMMTDAPSLVVYTGDYLESGKKLLSGFVSCPRCALALEAQEIPAIEPATLTAPGKNFSRTIRFCISRPD